MDELKVGVLLAFVGLVSNAAQVTIPLSNYHDVIYRGNVSVGTPPQTFEVVFHTGCTLTRFPARGCKSTGRFSDACDESKTYDPKASSTARPHIHPTFVVGEVQYTHFGASGREFYDDLTFGSQNEIVVKSATIGASSKVYAFDHAVVCLSMKSASTNEPTLSDMETAGVLTKPFMTVALRKCDKGECEDGGAITFGAYDYKNCEATIHWIPAITGSYMWRFHTQSIHINGHLVKAGAMANVDTGNSYIHIPKKYIAKVVELLNAKKQGSYYTVPCDSKFTMEFKIRVQAFKVNEEHMLLKNQRIEGQCVVTIYEAIDDSELFVLGSAFFRSVCVVHDIRKQRLGFASVKPQ